MQRFTTERLLIRPLTQQDENFYIGLYTNAKIMRNISPPFTETAAKRAFVNTLLATKKEKPKVMTWAIVRLEDNSVIGLQTLYKAPTKIAEIGIMLTTKANGQQYPEEAMGALMEYAFHYLSIDKINAYYSKKNLATERFIKKLGFIYDTTQQPINTENAYQYFNKNKWVKKLILRVI
jgi:RimJ/RimL family protein N-acetyltransferase